MMTNKTKTNIKIILSAALMLLGILAFNNAKAVTTPLAGTTITTTYNGIIDADGDIGQITSTLALTGISIQTPPTKTTYNVGDSETPDTTGMVVMGTYSGIIDSDGDIGTITQQIPNEDFTISSLNTSFAAANTTESIQVSVGTFSDSFTVSISLAKTLVSISITTQPTKTTYQVGDSTTPDTTGMVLTGTYSQIIDADGDLGTVTAPITSGFTTSLLDTSTSAATAQTVTVTYQTKTATYPVTLNPAPSPTPVPTGGGGGGGGYVPPTCKVADINCDGSIDELDFSIMMSQWGQTLRSLTADLNHDLIIDELDFSILMAHWGL